MIMKKFLGMHNCLSIMFIVGLMEFQSSAAIRPNFLFIVSDDHRYDALSVVQQEQGERGRFPWFKTPNLDRIATEGVRFRNAFVVLSLCAPSRAVFLTGRYNHGNGIASNFRPFPVDNVTHATLLRAAGYTTGYIGKWHMDSQRERPGFDYHASFIGHSVYNDPTFIVNGQDVKKKGWIDDISTEYALEFMRQQKGNAKPWSLVVGYKSPHGPFTPPERSANRFAGEMARTVPNMASPAPYSKSSQARTAKADATARTVTLNLDYFRCISAMDECVGRVLNELEQLGFAENTIVVYASDNGFYLGEHGLGDKRSAYDESLRIPFLVRYPKLGGTARGKLVDEMVLNLDFAPTLLDFAGVTIPADMQGKSWRPLLEGKQPAWRDSWFYEYFAENQKGSEVPDITGVRTRSAKLLKYPGHDEWTEVYDLATDPYETRNLAKDAAHVALRAKLEAEHERLAREVGYRVPDYVDRPPWWGKTETAPPAMGLVLEYTFAKDKGAEVVDASDQGNDGKADAAPIVEGRNGKKARKFSGKGYIDVSRSKSLNPADTAWTVEVELKADQAGGVVLARGGKTLGYALMIVAGKPQLVINLQGKNHTLAGKEPVAGRWAKVTGMLTTDRMARLYVDGQVVAELKVPKLFEKDPNDALQIGADLNSLVVEGVPAFTGLIDHVRLWRGEFQP